MSEPSVDYTEVDHLAEEFVGRHRRGERPSLTEYCTRYPHYAERIRTIFPALAMMERLKPNEPEDLASARGLGNITQLQRLGDYRVLREVGRGGMGIVYEAEQVSLGRRVALKVLLGHALLDTRHLQRFDREAKAAARLHHTNIVPVFGVGEQEGLHYYVMQFIQGLSLEKVLVELRRLRNLDPLSSGQVENPVRAQPSYRGCSAKTIAVSLVLGEFESASALPLPLLQSETDSVSVANLPSQGPAGTDLTAEVTVATDSTLCLPGQPDNSAPTHSGLVYYRSVARIGMQVAQALDYAHTQGVLHRDIKPSNLLLDHRGTVWVADFGLAKASDSDELTHTGDILGTFRYMAPERFEGRSDARSDVYALGLTLYEMLALEPAFSYSDRNEVIRRVMREDARRLRLLAPDVPGDLETIVHKAIDREPNRRYPTAAALADDLQRFVEDRPIRARRVGEIERAWRWCMRNKTLASLLAAAVILLVFLAGSSTVAALLYRQNLLQSKSAHREQTDQLAMARVKEAKALRLTRQPGQRFDSLRALEKAASMVRELGLDEQRMSEIRNEAIACLALPDIELAWEWDGNGELSPDFTRCAALDGRGNISIRALPENREIMSLPGGYPGKGIRIEWSPDGRFLVAVPEQGGELQVWDLKEDQPGIVHEGQAIFLPRPTDFASDGRRLVYCSPKGLFRIVELPSGQVREHPVGARVTAGMAFHPRESWITFGAELDGHHIIRTIDAQSGKVISDLPSETPIREYVVWHPGGEIFATVGDDLRIRLWNFRTGEQTLTFEDCKSGGHTFAFNHAGDLLLANDWDGILHIWSVGAGKPLLTRHIGYTYPFLHVSRDDRLIGPGLPATGKSSVYRLCSGNEFSTPFEQAALRKAHFKKTDREAWSADGRLFASKTSAGLAIYDVKQGTLAGLLPGGTSYLPMAFDTSGALITYGSEGVLRWPLQTGKGLNSWRLGPPQDLSSPNVSVGFHGSSRTGDVIAVPANSQGAVVLRRDPPAREVTLGLQYDVRYCAVSPDGHLVATGSHWEGEERGEIGVKLWDADSGDWKRDFRVRGAATVGFSPDGRWLVTGGDSTRLWNTQSGEAGPDLGETSSWAFTPDSSVIAVGVQPSVIRLVAVESGRELARLTSPEGAILYPRCFSPDGARLFCYGRYDDEMHVWNLRAIEQGLHQLGFDCDLPPLAEESRKDDGPPFRVEFDLGGEQLFPTVSDLGQRKQLFDVLLALQPFNARAYRSRGVVQYKLQHIRPALDDLWLGIVLWPPSAPLERGLAEVLNNVAWFNSTGPASERDLAKALFLAEKAVAMRPGQPVYLNSLGVILQKKGEFTRAAKTLKQSLAAGKGAYDAFDLFPLAGCYLKLGQTERARKCYDRAQAWVKQRGSRLAPYEQADLKTLQTEAEAALSAGR